MHYIKTLKSNFVKKSKVGDFKLPWAPLPGPHRIAPYENWSGSSTFDRKLKQHTVNVKYNSTCSLPYMLHLIAPIISFHYILWSLITRFKTDIMGMIENDHKLMFMK